MNIYFDLDGTVFDLYGLHDWLEKLENKISPFAHLETLHDTTVLTRLMNKAHRVHNLGVISWLPRGANRTYRRICEQDKLSCIGATFGTEMFDEIHILKYGTPKQIALGRKLTAEDVLIDDCAEVGTEWAMAGGTWIPATEILTYLQGLSVE